MQQTAIVDPVHGNNLTGQFGDLGKPFQTIQAAINAVPSVAIGNSAGSRTVWVILVSPGTYDEDLSVEGLLRGLPSPGVAIPALDETA